MTCDRFGMFLGGSAPIDVTNQVETGRSVNGPAVTPARPTREPPRKKDLVTQTQLTSSRRTPRR